MLRARQPDMQGMDIERIDIFLPGEGDGYVVAPAGRAPPMEQMRALGGIRYCWSQDLGAAASLPGWRAVRDDIDACGYGILADADFAALLLPGRLLAGGTARGALQALAS